jgi:hypothetical protein
MEPHTRQRRLQETLREEAVMKRLFALALSVSMVAPALAQTQTRDHASPITREYSQTANDGTTANPDTSIPDRIASPQDSVRQSPAVADEQSGLR